MISGSVTHALLALPVLGRLSRMMRMTTMLEQQHLAEHGSADQISSKICAPLHPSVAYEGARA